LSKTDSIAKEREGLKSFENNTKENLKFIYKQVEKQKQLFLELELKSIKIERESKVYKENYERLIIENNELKTRLKITKEQIVNYETNKLDLLSALNQLNEILSKSNIVAKISPQKTSSDVEDQKKETKIDSID
jgi:3-deoxy-D-manno-octulosonic-acid transferase